MKFSFLVLWPQIEVCQGLQSGQIISISDVPHDLKKMDLALSVSLPPGLFPQRELHLPIQEMSDFRPKRIIQNIPYLSNIQAAAESIPVSLREGLSPEAILSRLQNWPDLPLESSAFSLLPQNRPASSSSVDRILELVADPKAESSHTSGLKHIEKALTNHLEQVLSRIYADPDFRRLESLLRSINCLFRLCGKDIRIQCDLLPVDGQALESSIDQTLPTMIQRLPQLILLDFPLDSSSWHLGLLKKTATLAETLLIPALCWISPQFLGIDSWAAMDRLPYLPHHFDTDLYAKWRQFKTKPSSRWTALTCNRFLLRSPLNNRDGESGSPLNIKEPEPLWGSPVWALAGLILQSLAATSWPTHFANWKQIRLEGLDMARTPQGQMLPTETTFSEDRLEQFSRIGLVPLLGALHQDILFTPLDTTFGGLPLSNQLFASTISRELVILKGDYPGPAEPQSVRDYLEKNLADAFGLHSPENLDISLDKTPSGCQSRISITPSRIMLPVQQEFTMELDWS